MQKGDAVTGYCALAVQVGVAFVGCWLATYLAPFLSTAVQAVGACFVQQLTLLLAISLGLLPMLTTVMQAKDTLLRAVALYLGFAAMDWIATLLSVLSGLGRELNPWLAGVVFKINPLMYPVVEIAGLAIIVAVSVKVLGKGRTIYLLLLMAGLRSLAIMVNALQPW